MALPSARQQLHNHHHYIITRKALLFSFVLNGENAKSPLFLALEAIVSFPH